jgi:hypothetical protein
MRAYLRHGTRHNTIALIHAVTGPCALRELAPYVEPEVGAGEIELQGESGRHIGLSVLVAWCASDRQLHPSRCQTEVKRVDDVTSVPSSSIPLTV